MFPMGLFFLIAGFFAAATAATEVVGRPQQTSDRFPASALVSMGASAAVGGRLHRTRNYYVQSRRIGSATAANIAWENAGRQGRVLRVRRYRDIYFVVIGTSQGDKTYCVRDNGEYLGQC